MKSIMQTLASVALGALPLVNAITPAGMLAAPRRGVALANPSGVKFLLQVISQAYQAIGLRHLYKHELLLRDPRTDDSMGTAQLDIR